MSVDRLVPSEEAYDLLALVREIAAEQLVPRAAEDEAAERFPRDVFTLLCKSGLMALAHPEESGGGDQPYEVYLQVLEEVATAWFTIGLGMSVHSLSCAAMVHHGSEEQRAALLPDMLGGSQLGAYCLSEPQAGSDVSAIATKAVRDGDGYALTGTKAWITHGGHATSTSSSRARIRTRGGGCPRSTCRQAATGCRSGRRRRRWG